MFQSYEIQAVVWKRGVDAESHLITIHPLYELFNVGQTDDNCNWKLEKLNQNTILIS
jgi:hypothetical protein